MKKVAVIAHAGKTIGGGLEELRSVLAQAGDRRADLVGGAEEQVRPRARPAGDSTKAPSSCSCGAATAWCSGRSTCSRARGVTLAIIPAGTANLFASSLEIPSDIPKAVEIGLRGVDRVLDVGKINGERFAVMAGAGLDAHMINDADGSLKDRFGRLAYIWTASKNIRAEPFKAKIDINGELWYKGDASCVLLGNVGQLFGGIEAFDNAQPDDGLLEVGVTNAEGIGQWARTVARTAIGSTAKSPFVQVTKAKKIRIELDRKVAYELDGGERDPAKVLKAKIEPGAITVRVPHPE